MSQPKITLYTRPGCPDSAKSISYMNSLGLTWDEFDIDADKDAEHKVIGWTGRAVTPTIWIGDIMLTEPENAEIDAALAQAA